MTEQPEVAILADIGGTSARFALLAGGQPSDITRLAVADHASPVEAARTFLAKAGHQPQAAYIAAAGPVVNGRVSMVNAAWTIDTEEIRQGLGLRAATVINDFEALGWSLPGLQPQDLVAIGDVATPERGTMVVMGPGRARHRRQGRGGAGDRGRPRDAAVRECPRGCHRPGAAPARAARVDRTRAVRPRPGSIV
jgi:glucokinase